MNAIFSLFSRELIRFYRQPSRVIGAVGSPLIFWLFLGSGIGRSFRGGAGTNVNDYSIYFFPGVLLLILMFTAIFSTISIIEDRREGFLQAVLVSPASRAQILLGKISGGMVLALLQCLTFAVVAPFAGITMRAELIPLLVLVLTLNAFVLTTLGVVIAWQFQSIQGFHAVMNLFLMPMWMLSGALFPMEGAARWIQILMRANPLSYGMRALHILFFESPNQLFWNALAITCAFALILFGVALALVSKKSLRNVT